MGRARHVFGFAVTALTIGSSFPARAEDRATDAEALSSAAATLMEQGRYDEACVKYGASEMLEPSARRLLKWAECNERRGMTANAWLSFREALELAESNGEAGLARVAEEGAQRLEANLGKIEIAVPDAANVEGLEVWRDGALVPPSVYGLAVPVNPGTHVFAARAPGRRPWVTQIGIELGKTTIKLTIPRLELEPSAAPGVPSPMRARALAPATRGDAHASASDPGKTQRTAGLVLGGAGVVSLAAGTLFAFGAASTRNDAMRACPNSYCTAQSVQNLDQAQTLATAANAFMLLGAGSLIGGAIVYFTSPSAPERQTATVRVAPAFAPGNASLVAAGTF